MACDNNVIKINEKSKKSYLKGKNANDNTGITVFNETSNSELR